MTTPPPPWTAFASSGTRTDISQINHHHNHHHWRACMQILPSRVNKRGRKKKVPTQTRATTRLTTVMIMMTRSIVVQVYVFSSVTTTSWSDETRNPLGSEKNHSFNNASFNSLTHSRIHSLIPSLIHWLSCSLTHWRLTNWLPLAAQRAQRAASDRYR